MSAPTVAAPSAVTGTAVAATVVAARSRAHGPTSALWHAVALHRPIGEVDGACELTLCGSLARVDVEQPWPAPTRDVCPACVVLTR